MSLDRNDDLGLFHTGEQRPVDPRRSRGRRDQPHHPSPPQETTGSINVDHLRAALAGSTDDPRPVTSSAQDVARRRAERNERIKAQARRRRRRRNSVVSALVVLLLIAAGVTFGIWKWRDSKTEVVQDFGGTGGTEVFVQIRPGDGLNDIARTLTDAHVVASVEAFTDAASGDADVARIKPGYYRVRQQSSGASAVEQLLDPSSKTPSLRLIPGLRVADMTAVSKGVSRTIEGYFSQIAKASCQPLNGQTNCVSAAQLASAAETIPAQELGIVDWAIEAVDKAPVKAKRLEGMIVPGDYEIPPSADPSVVLKSVIQASTARWNATPIAQAAEALKVTPYQLAIIASIVQAESIDPEMAQVARVVFNRLDIGKKLELDTTVNYALDRAQITTTAADRRNPSPYNTYYSSGLPPTPIGAPSPAALAATYDPAPGSWLYFVTIDPKTGASCFSTTDVEHMACVEQARKNGVFDG